MRKPEQKLYDTLKAQIKARSQWRMLRTENVSTAGFPDVMLLKRIAGEKKGVSTLIELKATTRPKRKLSKFLETGAWSIDQVNFHVDCAQWNYPSYFLIRETEKRDLYLISGTTFLNGLNLRTLTWQEADSRFRVGSWDEVLNWIEADMIRMGATKE